MGESGQPRQWRQVGHVVEAQQAEALELLEVLQWLEVRDLLASAYRLNIPACVHVALGTDIVHQHPNFDAASTGKASYTDFKILAAQVARLNDGGVVLHFGSAVVLPEVFLKALSVARNIRGKVQNFTTANFDMIQHYRPNVNVVLRPTQKSGKGFSFTGHHEIMIPLLAWALKSADQSKQKRR